MSANLLEPQKISGIGVSAGISMGRAVLMGVESTSSDNDLSSDPVVLVGQAFSHEEVLSMDRQYVCGFVTVAGGRTAGAGIVAQSSGLSAVLACPECVTIKMGDLLIVDGARGEVVINPTAAMIEDAKRQQGLTLQQQENVGQYRHLPAETKDGLQVDIFASINLVDAIPHAITSGASGIGLLRSEFYYLTGDGAPTEAFLFTLYQHALSSVAPLPVTIRTLDLSDGMQVCGFEQDVGHNPALGLKGVRFSLHHHALFKTQLRALYRASAFGRLRILLPMIGSLDELLHVKALLVAVRDELLAEGLKIADDVEIGVLIEVPSAVLLASSLANEVDFFTLGMNNLMQYGLAIDRGNQDVAHLYEPLHPAILQMIQQVVLAGHDAGIGVGICGEMAGDVCYTPLLLGFELDWFSVPSATIGGIKKMVRKSLACECTDLATHLLGESSAQSTRRFLDEYLQTHYLDRFEKLV